MKHVEDNRWRDAAATLGLGLLGANGKEVTPERATRRHRMRGSLDGRLVTVRYGLQSLEDRIIAIEIRLTHPLLLGLSAQASAPPRTSRGVVLGGGLRTSVDAIDVPRARAMFQTASGTKAKSLIEWLGSLGWVELRDADLRVQCEVLADQSSAYVKIVRAAAEAASLAEAARRELAPMPWELRLGHELQGIASDLQIAFDPRRLRLAGRSRDSTIELGLHVADRYSLLCRVGLSTGLPEGTRVSRRTTFGSKVLAFLGLDRPTQNRTFNTMFEATLPIRNRLTQEIASRIVDLSRMGDVDVDEHGVSHRVLGLDADVSDALQRTIGLVDALSGRSAASPYRSAAR